MTFYFGFLLALSVIGLVFYSKGIKTVKILNIDYRLLSLVLLLIINLVIRIIVPLNTYYIKIEDYTEESPVPDLLPASISMMDIIEDEINRQNIPYDNGTLRLLSSFRGNTGLIYLCKYERDGEEVVGAFGFERNILGNLKPMENFKESSLIPKSDEEVYYGNNFNDGYPRFYITYGYEEYNQDREELSSDGYFLSVERTDRWGSSDFVLIIFILLTLYFRRKIEDGKATYEKVIKPGKRIDLIRIVYYEKEGD